MQPGDHGTTFGGSPVPCAAALEHLRVRATLDIDANVDATGAVLLAGLRALHETYPQLFAPPRGIGLMLGLPVRAPYETKAIVDAARLEERLLVNGAGDNTLRFVPALILTEDQARDATARLQRIASRMSA